MRVELYGCQFKDDIVSYETRNGDLRNSNSGAINFQDKIYDGIQTENGYLKGGLGLLTDGELGDDSFRHERYGIKGYEWVGWRNDSTSHGGLLKHHEQEDQPHRILFNFDNIRNFSLCTLYINNVPNQRIELYSLIRFKFSINGIDFVNDLESTLNRDSNMAMARPILVPLKFNMAKYVLIELYFYSKWLLISEIAFDSEYVDLDGHNFNPTILIGQQTRSPNIYLNELFNSTIKSFTVQSSSSGNETLLTNHLTLQTLIMILITLLTFLIMVFIFIIYCFIKKRKRLNKKFQHHYHHHHKSLSAKKRCCFNWIKLKHLFCKKSNATNVANNINTTGLTTPSTTSTSGATTTTSTAIPINAQIIAALQQKASLFSHPQLSTLDTMKSTKFLTSFENSLESTYLYPSLKYKAIGTNENSEVLKALLNNQQQQRHLKLIETNNNNNNNIHYATTDISSSATTTSSNSTNSKMVKLIPIQQYNITNHPMTNNNLYYTIKPQSTFNTDQTLSRCFNANKHLQIQQQQQQQQQIEFVSMRKIDANLLCFLDKVGESTVSNVSSY